MEERRTERLVVVGNGMVSHRFLELVAARAARNAGASFEVTVVGEEPRQSKLTKAQKAEVPILAEPDLLALLGES